MRKYNVSAESNIRINEEQQSLIKTNIGLTASKSASVHAKIF